jgi:hypothetical protein
MKGHQIESVRLGQALDRFHEPLSHGGYHRGRRHPDSQLRLQEIRETGSCLQRRHVSIQIQAVDPFQFEPHMFLEDFSNAFAYHGDELPESAANPGHRPKRVHYLGAGRKPCLLPGAPRIAQHARRSEAGPR